MRFTAGEYSIEALTDDASLHFGLLLRIAEYTGTAVSQPAAWFANAHFQVRSGFHEAGPVLSSFCGRLVPGLQSLPSLQWTNWPQTSAAFGVELGEASSCAHSTRSVELSLGLPISWKPAKVFRTIVTSLKQVQSAAAASINLQFLQN